VQQFVNHEDFARRPSREPIDEPSSAHMDHPNARYGKRGPRPVRVTLNRLVSFDEVQSGHRFLRRLSQGGKRIGQYVPGRIREVREQLLTLGSGQPSKGPLQREFHHQPGFSGEQDVISARASCRGGWHLGDSRPAKAHDRSDHRSRGEGPRPLDHRVLLPQRRKTDGRNGHGATIGLKCPIPNHSHDVTGLLKAWGQGDEAALNALVPLVHDELRRIARGCLRGEAANHSVQATALVNEAFLRLVDVQHVDWQSRIHFLAMSARLMRRVLVDLARSRRADKRGGGAVRVTFDEAIVGTSEPEAEVIRLDDALQALAALDRRKSRVVELRFFGGLSLDETAAALRVSSKTVQRDWEFARAWLQQEMTHEVGYDA
jgi:RNA polymerase sigma-70 factor (ECF subfamily)